MSAPAAPALPVPPGKAAVVEGDTVRTHGELEARADRLANALLDLGARRGGRVAVMLPNGIALFESHRAAARAQCSVVPVNWHLKAHELSWILADCEAPVVVAHTDFAPHVEAALPEGAGTRVLWVGDDVPAGGDRYEDAVARAAPTPPAPDAAVVPRVVLYTSGTSGRPKGVVHTYERGVSAHPALWGFTADDVHLLAAPAYHGAPWSFANTHLAIGATVVVLGRWDARRWLGLVERHRVTDTFAVPAHLVRVLEVPAAERAAFDLSSLRLVVHAGAPCPVDVKRRFMAAFPGVEVWEFYGFSEGGRVTRISPAEWVERPGSVGRPLPGVEVAILADDGTPLPAGGTGLVYVRPPGGGRFHYHGDDEKTAGAWRGDFCTVGDVGHLDADGYLYVTDRASDMILRGGVNIYPREIEDVLHRHPAVVDCAVYGVPHERDGEAVSAMVETSAPVGADELAAHCRAFLADYKCPTRWVFVDALPRDPNGKVRKQLLR